jgi:hypothetical protein
VTCPVCDRPVAPGTRAPGGTCNSPECRKAFAEWATSRRRNVRRARHERLTGERTCDGCGETFPLDAEHFKPVGRGYYRRRCIECQRAVERAHSRAAYARLKASPERYTAYLANTRLRDRLRRERETGRTPTRQFRAAAGAYRSNVGTADLPVEPLQWWLQAVIEREAPELGRPAKHGQSSLESIADREGTTAEGLARMLGVDSRALWRIQHAEHKTISIGTADGLLTNYGRPVVVRDRDIERSLVEWAQELPGNGTRILRYIDRAEQLAERYSGVALMRLEDVYPELDG